MLRNVRRHPFRLLLRLAWLGIEFLLAACAWLFSGRHGQSRWLHRHAIRIGRVVRLRVHSLGRPPSGGFLVANHLSYLDILVLGSCTPCRFVAKREVRGWPVLGPLATMAGTIYVNRESRADIRPTTGKMRRAVSDGALVILFPEGTSSDGSDVLPFKSSLLAPLAQEAAVGAAHLSYTLRDGSVTDEICYWRDMTLLPHLLNLLTKDEVTATVRFGRMDTRGDDRKTLARRLRDEVKALGSAATAEQ
jgi:1-acyl-sn-glycerol-3-phosphate acyltransferase